VTGRKKYARKKRVSTLGRKREGGVRQDDGLEGKRGGFAQRKALILRKRSHQTREKLKKKKGGGGDGKANLITAVNHHQGKRCRSDQKKRRQGRKR